MALASCVQLADRLTHEAYCIENEDKRIIWLEDVVEKLEQKHSVKQEEVKQIFANSPYFRFVEKGHRRGENVYSAMGRTEAGRF